MPDEYPTISKDLLMNLEDALDKRYIDGFNKGHEIGYKAGFEEARKFLEAQLVLMAPTKPESFVDAVRQDLGLSEEPTPIKEAYGFEIIETDTVVPKPRKKRLVSVKALGLSTKTQNALTNAGITKIKQLTEMSSAELRKVPRVGAGSVKEIVAVLKKHGRSLKTK